jgi:hypothetical protein
MEQISLEIFFNPETDWEMNQYRILGGIKTARAEFDKKRIYPALAMLIKLKRELNQIKDEKNNLSQQFPKQIAGFDIKEQKVIYEASDDLNRYENIEVIFDLVDWAIPHINKAIEEGIVLFDFVEENMFLEQVGILPMYKEEGYFMINDNIAMELQVHRYECTLFSSGEEKYRSLKTEFVKSKKQGIIIRSPEEIKQELIKERTDLPNPATFHLDSELDFPFAETILPVAKRKRISHIAA